METAGSVDAKLRRRFKRIRAQLETLQPVLERQGAVVASWKTYRGQRRGPYFRVAFRLEGRQRSIYLGASPWLAQQVRGLLTVWQGPLRTDRWLTHALTHARSTFRQHLALFHRWVAPLGVTAKGLEFRGLVRWARRQGALNEWAARDERAARARAVIRGLPEEPEGKGPARSR